MVSFSDIDRHVQTLHALIGDDPAPDHIPGRVAVLDDDAVVAAITSATAAIQRLESLRVAATGVAAARSSRSAGHGGLSQVRGFGSAVSLVQQITGGTRADAVKHVRAGQALLEGAGLTGTGDPLHGNGVHDADDGGADGDASPGGDGSGGDGPGGDGPAPAPRRPWHAVLGDALLEGRLSKDQHDAVRRGLGEPPTVDAAAVRARLIDPDSDTTADTGTGTDAGTPIDPDADLGVVDGLVAAAWEEARAAWEAAAGGLVVEAACRAVEDLAAQARAIRDLLDPEGAARRFQDRHQKRSFRSWVDRDGVHHSHIVHDDEGALWTKTILDAALAPRRGVRFIDPDQQTRAKALASDPRTTDQLAYDLIIDLLRAGALADADTVFGVRRAGIRVLTTQRALNTARTGRPAVACAQDDTTTLPGWLAAAHACDTGTRECMLDGSGNPLDLGREARLYTPAQKLTLAIRDGGCRWPDCDRPAHYCEAHHIDEWASGGTTDIDRGILLCRYHHGQLHHGGWRITRTRTGPFQLHPPGRATPITLTTRLARQYLWRADPPPQRFQPAA